MWKTDLHAGNEQERDGGFPERDKTLLSREMCRMRDEGLIDFHRFSVRIRDMEALKAAAQGRH